MATPEEIQRQEQLNKLVSELAGITQETLENQRSISNALQDSLGSLKFEKSERSAIRSITKEVNKIATDSRTILKEQLGTTKNIAEIEKSQDLLQKRKIALQDIFSSLSEDQLRAVEALGLGLKDQIESINKINIELEDTKTTSKDIADVFGVKLFSNIEGVAGKLESLTGLKLKKPFSEAASATRKVAASGETASKAFSAGASSIGKAAVAALPLLIFTELVKAFIQIDKSSGKIAKNLGISYNEAIGLNREFTSIANSSNNIFVTTESLGEAFLSINNALGTNSTLSGDLLVTQTELVKQAGYSVEAATQLATLSLATGTSSKDITTEFLGQLTLLNLQNKTSINEKVILESINKISKSTLATFAAQPKELAEAIFQAKKLGLELNQLEKIQSGLLDIESSIRAEFVAETVTGEELNLGLARRFALENKLVDLGKELEKQGITRAKFANMNFIQQDAYARALNLEKSELGEILLEREALNRLSGIEGATAQERFNNAVKTFGIESATARLGDSTLANQLASVSAQERFNQSISKLRDLFVVLIDPLIPILDILGDIASLASVIVKVLDPILQATSTVIKAFNPTTPRAEIRAAVERGNQSMRDNWFKPLGLIEDSNSNLPITTPISNPNNYLSSLSNSNLRGTSRNESSSMQLDYNKLADAIAKGAERGTSKATLALNIDGRKFADSQQVPGVLGQYKFSS